MGHGLREFISFTLWYFQLSYPRDYLFQFSLKQLKQLKQIQRVLGELVVPGTRKRSYLLGKVITGCRKVKLFL